MHLRFKFIYCLILLSFAHCSWVVDLSCAQMAEDAIELDELYIPEAGRTATPLKSSSGKIKISDLNFKDIGSSVGNQSGASLASKITISSNISVIDGTNIFQVKESPSTEEKTVVQAVASNETEIALSNDLREVDSLAKENLEGVDDVSIQEESPQINIPVISLQEACRLAVVIHPMIGGALASKDEALANYGVSRSVYYPRLDFQANVGPSHDLDTATTEYGDSSLTMSQVIYDFGGLQNSVEGARNTLASVNTSYVRTKEDIMAITANAYLSILQGKALLEVYENSLVFYNQLLNTFWERYNAGISSKADAQKVEVTIKSTESQLVVYNEQLKTAKNLLSNIIERPVGDIEPNTSIDDTIISNTLDEVLAIAYDNNVKLKASLFDMKAQKLILASKRSEYYPSIGYKIAAKNELKEFDNYENSVDAQLTVNWNIFNGFATDNRVDAAAAILRRYEATHRNLKLEMKNVITDSYNSYQSSQEEYKLAQEAYESSNYLMGLYLSEFDLGIRTLLDLITAREGQTSAAVREVNARFARMRATLNITLEEGQMSTLLGVLEEDGIEKAKE